MKSASKLNSTFDDDDEGKGDFDQSEQVSRLLQMPAGVSEHCSVVIWMIMIVIMIFVMTGVMDMLLIMMTIIIMW